MTVLEDRKLGRGKCHHSKNEEWQISSILSFYVFCNCLNTLERLRKYLEKLCHFLKGQRVKHPGPVQAGRTSAIYTSSFIRSRHTKGILHLETKEINIIVPNISFSPEKKECSSATVIKRGGKGSMGELASGDQKYRKTPQWVSACHEAELCDLMNLCLL